jgi:hypothetical protein
MNKPTFSIADMVDDLEPVRPVSIKGGLAIAAAITLTAIAAVIMRKGMRADLLAGHPSEMFLLRAGILLLLGVATAYSVLSMASPGVGKQGNGWKIALSAATLFPLAAMIVAMTGNVGPAITEMQSGVQCMTMSLIGGVATAIPMVLWLRKGAPTNLERAGWLTGVAAGGLGAFAYNFHCPFESIVYIGLWYTLAVGACAIIGRLLVPRLIRW